MVDRRLITREKGVFSRRLMCRSGCKGVLALAVLFARGRENGESCARVDERDSSGCAYRCRLPLQESQCLSGASDLTEL